MIFQVGGGGDRTPCPPPLDARMGDIGLSSCTGDNPVAKARLLSHNTGGQTPWYNYVLHARIQREDMESGKCRITN